MKKVIFSISIIAITSSALLAQVSFGPKIGGGCSILKDTKIPTHQYSTESAKYSFVPQIGGVLNIDMGQTIAIRPELMFNQRATKIIDNPHGVPATGNIRLSYIELPVNVAIGARSGPGKLEFFAGPAIALCLGGKLKAQEGFSGNSESKNTSIKAGKNPVDPYDISMDPNIANSTDYTYINPLNFSLNFGIDYKFDNGILLQASYNAGLSNIHSHFSNKDLEASRREYVTKASSFNFGLAYLFSKKK